jgi:pimeloyl-ACP methyl ester carboxylesterase
MHTLVAPFLIFGLASAMYCCRDFDVPMSFVAPHVPPNFPPFENHYQSVAFLNAISARNVASAPSPFGEPANITVEATIAAQYCTPNNQKPTVVQVLTHGLGFDHTYWDFGGPGSEYNYVEAATAAGYATLSYDRLGNGKSSIKNPYSTQQLGVEVAVVATLTTLLREGGLSRMAGIEITVPVKVVHVGHSFGSAITHALVGSAPSLSDAAVLTGYSTVFTWTTEFAVSTGFHIAKEIDPARFSAYAGTGWLTWADELGNQYGFFHYPAFSPDVLAQAEAGKFPFAIGELLTGAGAGKAPAWTGPLLVCLSSALERLILPLASKKVNQLTNIIRLQLISGEYDQIFCGSWCHGVLSQAKPFFPNASVSSPPLPALACGMQRRC